MHYAPLIGFALFLAACSSTVLPVATGSEGTSVRPQANANTSWSEVKRRLRTGKDQNGNVIGKYIRNATFQSVQCGQNNNNRLPEDQGDVITEGQSYVMMMAVQMNDKATFDAVWKWTKTYMRQSNNLFAWRAVPECNNVDSTGKASDNKRFLTRWDGTQYVEDRNSASDGEEYMLTALIFAQKRWGGSYLGEAKTLQSAMKSHLFVNATGDPYRGMVKFTQVNPFTDPSYHLPAFYTIWAQVSDTYGWGNGGFWRTAATTSRKFLENATQKFRNGSGLTPDYASYDGSPYYASWNNTSHEFGYDAFRTAMNWTLDYMWNGNQDSAELKSFTKSWNLLDFFNSQDGNPYDSNLGYQSLCRSDGWCRDGKKAGLVAMNGVASLIVPSHPRALDFKNELLNQNPAGMDYYSLMLHTLGTLIATGNYQKYMP